LREYNQKKINSVILHVDSDSDSWSSANHIDSGSSTGHNSPSTLSADDDSEDDIPLFKRDASTEVSDQDSEDDITNFKKMSLAFALRLVHPYHTTQCM
jgi:hypothetical protein